MCYIKVGREGTQLTIQFQRQKTGDGEFPEYLEKWDECCELSNDETQIGVTLYL
jgi:hypothetical protein